MFDAMIAWLNEGLHDVKGEQVRSRVKRTRSTRWFRRRETNWIKRWVLPFLPSTQKAIDSRARTWAWIA